MNTDHFLSVFSVKSVANNLRAEAAAVFVGEDEAEDHVTEVARVVSKRCDPVVVTNRVRIAAQVAEVLHRHERADEELPQPLCSRRSHATPARARLLITIERGNQLGLVT